MSPIYIFIVHIFYLQDTVIWGILGEIPLLNHHDVRGDQPAVWSFRYHLLRYNVPINIFIIHVFYLPAEKDQQNPLQNIIQHGVQMCLPDGRPGRPFKDMAEIVVVQADEWADDDDDDDDEDDDDDDDEVDR